MHVTTSTHSPHGFARQTAFFVIPENVKHGEELICSYFACRNAGIKFRYCSHCKVPVAKRNFRKRHKHGGDLDVSEASHGVVVAARPNVTSMPVPTQITTASRPDVEDEEEDDDDDAVSSQSPLAAVAKKEKSTTISATTTATQQQKRAIWTSLFTERHQCRTASQLKTWLERVLAVSSDPTANTSKTNISLDTSVAQAIWDATTPSSAQSRDKVESDDDDDPDDDADHDHHQGKTSDTENEEEEEEVASSLRKRSASPKTKFDEWKDRKKQRKLEAQLAVSQQEQV
jgi:hypothetical protein